MFLCESSWDHFLLLYLNPNEKQFANWNFLRSSQEMFSLNFISLRSESLMFIEIGDRHKPVVHRRFDNVWNIFETVLFEH